jgi:Leucine-rich repeat (LRR) protein
VGVVSHPTIQSTNSATGSNKLTHIPPQIKGLKNLQELDVSVNKLQYLPAEMLQMKLFTLNINANPFLRNDSPSFAPLETRVGVSKPELAGNVALPSLKECCFRVLFRKTDGSDHTNLEAKYGSSQEVSVWNLSDGVRQVLNDCIPGSVSVGPRNKRQKLDDGYEEETRLGMGVCPSPHHEETSYFVEPVEVRRFVNPF